MQQEGAERRCACVSERACLTEKVESTREREEGVRAWSAFKKSSAAIFILDGAVPGLPRRSWSTRFNGGLAWNPVCYPLPAAKVSDGPLRAGVRASPMAHSRQFIMHRSRARSRYPTREEEGKVQARPRRRRRRRHLHKRKQICTDTQQQHQHPAVATPAITTTHPTRSLQQFPSVPEWGLLFEL